LSGWPVKALSESRYYLSGIQKSPKGNYLSKYPCIGKAMLCGPEGIIFGVFFFSA
jgi:hypothetical protein